MVVLPLCSSNFPQPQTRLRPTHVKPSVVLVPCSARPRGRVVCSPGRAGGPCHVVGPGFRVRACGAPRARVPWWLRMVVQSLSLLPPAWGWQAGVLCGRRPCGRSWSCVRVRRRRARPSPSRGRAVCGLASSLLWCPLRLGRQPRHVWSSCRRRLRQSGCRRRPGAPPPLRACLRGPRRPVRAAGRAEPLAQPDS